MFLNLKRKEAVVEKLVSKRLRNGLTKGKCSKVGIKLLFVLEAAGTLSWELVDAFRY